MKHLILTDDTGNHLQLNDYIPPKVAANGGELWMRLASEPDKSPTKVADVIAGQSVRIPFTSDEDVILYLVSHDPSGKKTVVDLKDAVIAYVSRDTSTIGVPILVDGPPSVALIGNIWVFNFPKPLQNGYTAKNVQYALLNDTNYKTTVAAYDTDDDSIELNNVIGFPTSGRCYVGGGPNDGTDEIFSYTGIAGNTLTGVVRGRDGTTPQSMTNGNVIFQIQFQAELGDRIEYQFPQIDNTLILIYRWQNDHRENSDGWSLWSPGAYAYVSTSGVPIAPPSAPPAEPPAPPAGYEDPYVQPEKEYNYEIFN